MANGTAKRKIPETPDMMGVTLMMEAAKRNLLAKIVECLESGHNINAADNAGYTALLHAVVAGKEEAALMLMHHKADLTRANRAGQNALHVATEKRLDQVVERWARMQGPLDAQDKVDGHTALMNAILSDNAWAACRLVDAGADFDKLEDKHGNTAEAHARRTFGPEDLAFFRAAAAGRRALEAKQKKEKSAALSRAAHTLHDDVAAPPRAQFRKKGPNPAA